MQVKEVMIPRAEAVAPQDSLQEALDKMKRAGLGVLPVLQDETLVGVLSEDALTHHARSDGGHPKQSQVRDVMLSQVVACYEDQPVEEVAAAMRRARAGYTLVLNRDGALTGVFSLDKVLDPQARLSVDELLRRLTHAEDDAEGDSTPPEGERRMEE